MTLPDAYTEEQVAAGLAAVDVLDVVRGAFLDHHRERTTLPAEACLRWEGPDGGAARSIAMHAHLAGSPARIGIKVINSAIRNPQRGMPRAAGVIALFDPLTAQITALMPAGAISAARTAAVSALAARYLARPGPGRLALIGAGALASAHVRILEQELDMDELVVFDLDRDRAERLAAASGLATARAAASAREAIEGAGVVVTATTVTEPYVEFGWLAPGSLTINVSLDDLQADVFAKTEVLLVDDWATVIADPHRLLGRLARGGRIVGPGEAPTEGARAVTAELGTVFAGQLPARDDDQRVVLNPFGLAISDVALAAAVAESLGAHAVSARRAAGPAQEDQTGSAPIAARSNPAGGG